MNTAARKRKACTIIVVTLALTSIAGAQNRVNLSSGTFDPDPPTLFERPFSAQSAIQVTLSVDTKTGSVNTCEGSMSVSAFGDMTSYGTWTYTWTLYRDGQMVNAPQKQTITCREDDAVCESPHFDAQIPSVSGMYRIKLATLFTSDSLSNKVQVTAAPPCPPKERGDLLHVIGLTTDGKLWHSIRFATEYTWQSFQNVWLPTIDEWGLPGKIVDVSSATLDNELHVLVVNDAGKSFTRSAIPTAGSRSAKSTCIRDRPRLSRESPSRQ